MPKPNLPRTIQERCDAYASGRFHGLPTSVYWINIDEFQAGFDWPTPPAKLPVPCPLPYCCGILQPIMSQVLAQAQVGRCFLRAHGPTMAMHCFCQPTHQCSEAHCELSICDQDYVYKSMTQEQHTQWARWAFAPLISKFMVDLSALPIRRLDGVPGKGGGHIPAKYSRCLLQCSSLASILHA